MRFQMTRVEKAW